MKNAVKPIPDGYPAVTPLLVMNGAARAIEFYKTVFGAKEKMRMQAPNGKLGHAELTIGDSVIMLSDAFPESGDRVPSESGTSPVRIHIYVDDVDQVAERAVAAGGKMVIPLKDQFYGDRSGRLQDPFGHIWLISTHQQDVSQEEMQRRMEKTMGKPA